jgi:uncharacterized protein YjiS (DUF1127 family)
MVEAAMTTRAFFLRWAEYRQPIGELKRYSDVELAEPGMVRSACAQTAVDAAFRSPFGDLRRWLTSRLRYRQTCNELKRLSERECEDLGIPRKDFLGAHARRDRDTPRELATLRLDRIPIIH